MRSPPLGELYDLLRADGFAIGVDDHIRIGRLLARDLAWTSETLRISIAALVVTDPDQRIAFDACWECWVRGAEPAATTEAARLPVAVPRVPRVPPPKRGRRILLGVTIASALVSVLALRCFGVWPAPDPPIDGVVAGAPPIDAGAHRDEPAIGAGQGSPARVPTSHPPPRPPPPLRTTFDLALVGLTFGTILLVSAALAGAVGARARRRFRRGPWRYALAVPPATRPVLPRIAIEDAAAELTRQAPETGRELDIARTIAATVACGGLPTLVYRRSVAATRYLVLEDTASGGDRWRFLYDELLRGLAREGVKLERYAFAVNPERCADRDGRVVALDDLVDHGDALIAIGDGDGAIDPLTGGRAEWLASLRHVPRRLWINPIPPGRWSAGAHAIAADTAMAHGVAVALEAWSAGVGRRARVGTPYPAVIERAPGTASAVAALRAALGDRAFVLVAGVALVGSPTIAVARWLAETHALELDEHDWLRVATLPWFRTEQWPDGLRDLLVEALGADAPGLAGAIALTSERLFSASEPPRDSGAHLAWQLEGARRAGRRGERVAAARALGRIAGTPLVYQARDMLAGFDLPDRRRRALVSAVVVGAALVVAGGSAGLVAQFGGMPPAGAVSGPDPESAPSLDDRGNPGTSRRLPAYDRASDLALLEGRLEDARTWYKLALAIRTTLASADPSNTGLQGDVAATYTALGGAEMSLGELDDARSSFEQALAVRRTLASADPGNAGAASDLAASYDQLGEVAESLGKLDEARGWYDKALAVRERLASADPTNTDWQRDLSATYGNLGRVASSAGKRDDAQGWFDKANAVNDALAAATNNNAAAGSSGAVSGSGSAGVPTVRAEANVEIHVSSAPPGARIFVDGIATGKLTPSTLSFPRTKGQKPPITLYLKGYNSASFEVDLGESSQHRIELVKASTLVAGCRTIERPGCPRDAAGCCRDPGKGGATGAGRKTVGPGTKAGSGSKGSAEIDL